MHAFTSNWVIVASSWPGVQTQGPWTLPWFKRVCVRSNRTCARKCFYIRGDLICHEFIHKLTWPIMRQLHALRSLFITLHCVTLLRLNLVQSVYDAVSRIRAKHVSNRCVLVYREIF